ncbi:DUF4236 domain-containing protein [Desulfosporosinus sp. SB140]|uniref:DUF4236 domain-containing protein n=1 Tax=Desulfosporosinus paludis TaxID=3115649 RepID=UPI00388CFAC9
MGFRFRKQIGPKGLKLNVGKKGANSTSLKIAPGITVNSNRGLTVGIPGTGISYNTGRKKAKKSEDLIDESSSAKSILYDFSPESAKVFKDVTGGYNKKPFIAIGISLILCLTPIWPIGLVSMMFSLAWLVIDLSYKLFKYYRHVKKLRKEAINLAKNEGGHSFES